MEIGGKIIGCCPGWLGAAGATASFSDAGWVGA